MTFFKKKISSEEMATGLYHATITNAVKDDLKDQDNNVILSKKEQTIMLVQHLYDLLERHKFDKPKLHALMTYVANNYDLKEENDHLVYMAISLEEFKKVGDFFKDLSPESHKFFKKAFLFDKDLNPIQKTLAMAWYVEHCKIIDSAFQLGLKEFKVVDKE